MAVAPVYTVRVNRVAEPTILNRLSDWGGRSTSRPGRCNYGTQWIGGTVGHTAGPNILLEEKNLLSKFEFRKVLWIISVYYPAIFRLSFESNNSRIVSMSHLFQTGKRHCISLTLHSSHTGHIAFLNTNPNKQYSSWTQVRLSGGHFDITKNS